MKLEVGMYVRTKDRIVKIEKIEDGVMWDTQGHLHFGDFSKASHNIIDLIEVGDCVNGNKIVHIQEEEYPYYPKRLIFAGVDTNNPNDVWECYNNDDIKSIVTKEQIESMSYKVGE